MVAYWVATTAEQKVVKTAVHLADMMAASLVARTAAYWAAMMVAGWAIPKAATTADG